MSNKFRAAVVGCGGGGMVNHIPWYAQNPHVELVGLVDPNSACRDSATTYGGRFYNDVKDMLSAEKPDIVSIASPVSVHCEQTLACLENGCHVLCEKPMAPTLAECQRMIDAARDHHRQLGMGMDKRYSLAFAEARRLVQDGMLGNLMFLRVHVAMSQAWMSNPDAQPGFRGELTTGGGAFQDLGSHYLDLCEWLTGQSLTGISGRIDIMCPRKMEVEDLAAATIRFDNGLWGTIEALWMGPMDRDFAHIEELWLYGSDAVLKVRNVHRMEPLSLELWDRSTGQWRNLKMGYDLGRFSHYQYKRMIDRFVECVRTDQPFEPDGNIGRNVIGAVLGLYEASSTDREVALPLASDPDVKDIFTTLREQALRRH